jgi:hypothetical protein
MIAWAKQQLGVCFDHWCLASAAVQGDMAMCRYLVNEGCTWDYANRNHLSCVSREAGERGNVDALRCLVETNCPLHFKEVCAGAAQSGNIDVLQHVQQLGHLIPDYLTEVLLYTGYNNQLAAAKWLREQGVAWPQYLRFYNEEGGSWGWSSDLIEWARSEGCVYITILLLV